jgi:hypothetical protein
MLFLCKFENLPAFAISLELFDTTLRHIDRLRPKPAPDMTNELPFMQADDGTGASGKRGHRQSRTQQRPICS